MKRSHLTREIIELIVIVLVLFVVIRYVVHSYYIREVNMAPAIQNNSYVMVNRASYLFSSPQRGDAIVFHYPLDTNQDAMARVIGLPGDHIKVDNQHVWVNNVLLNETYVKTPVNFEGHEWAVPTHAYFVLNDNRQINDDSRSWGTLNQDYVVGKAILVYWPSSDWRFISSDSDVFSHIK